MDADVSPASDEDVQFGAFWPFLLITFGLAWGLIALFMLFPAPMTKWFGEISGQHPLFMLAVYAPAIAAISLVLRGGGWAGLRCFLSRLLLWRCHIAWWALLLIGIPLLFAGGAALKGNLLAHRLPFDAWQPLALALFMALITGPVEEFGWRGLALPLLQRRLAPLWAGLILGLVWGLWHLPAFFLGGAPQSAWPFMPFFVGAAAVSVIVTPLFNAARGSILLPALLHWQLNNPLWPDAQPYDTVFFVGAAIVVVWLNRRTMFRREGAVTAVIPDALHHDAVHPEAVAAPARQHRRPN